QYTYDRFAQPASLPSGRRGGERRVGPKEETPAVQIGHTCTGCRRRNMRCERAYSSVNDTNISLPSRGIWRLTGEPGLMARTASLSACSVAVWRLFTL